MKQLGRGEAAELPSKYKVFLVAHAYGQTPESVRDWPADDFAIACRMLEVAF